MSAENLASSVTTIVERVAELGPTVRLLHISQGGDLKQQLVGVTPPTTILTAVYHRVRSVTAHDPAGIAVELERAISKPPDLDTKLFDFGDGSLQSVADVLHHHFFGGDHLLEGLERNKLTELSLELGKSADGGVIARLARPGGNLKIAHLKRDVDLEVTDCPVDWSSSRYVQAELDELGWVLEG